MAHKEERVLYSKRFPRVDIEQILKDIRIVDAGLKAEFADLCKQAAVEPIFPETEEKRFTSRLMMRQAIAMSERYDVDVDITEGHQRVTVTLFLDYGPYLGGLRDCIAMLFELCDSFMIGTAPNSDKDFAVSFWCYTYEYVSRIRVVGDAMDSEILE